MTSQRPARPSRETIIRRRIGALIVLLLVVGLIIWAVVAAAQWVAGQLGDDEPEPTTTASAVESASAAGPPVECAPEDLTVVLEASGQYAGQPVDLSPVITNSGDVPCLVDASGENLVVEVASGADAVWSSAHCAPEGPRNLLIPAGEPATARVVWDGARSAPGCPDGAEPAQPGTYQAQVTLGRTTPGAGQTTFSLEAAPESETESATGG